ncbi:hypothetical protein [Rhizobium binae]|uniref:hypothetical protein n=1 Tax=Rhizobium binae TaxID=1138190 RepID=UPI001C836840|nr:hypothetical protein [Rhizobium binae]MBX4967867.1 hypothetical protein [Rhizobium binae]
MAQITTSLAIPKPADRASNGIRVADAIQDQDTGSECVSRASTSTDFTDLSELTLWEVEEVGRSSSTLDKPTGYEGSRLAAYPEKLTLAWRGDHRDHGKVIISAKGGERYVGKWRIAVLMAVWIAAGVIVCLYTFFPEVAGH